MPLPPLLIREKLLYKDLMTVYRANAVDSEGEPTGWYIANISVADPTPLQNVPCNYHRTPNFDIHQSIAGMSKEVNLMTSNNVTCQYAVPLQSQDLLFITTRWGDTEWNKVDGAAENEVLVPCTCVYTVPFASPPFINDIQPV
jgi:hypothetical protein